MTFAKAGLLAGAGSPTQDDLDLIQQAGIEAIKLRAKVNLPSDLAAYRGAGIHTFLVQLLSPEPAQQPTSPDDFVNHFADDIAAFLKAGVSNFEIHGEPNASQRGYNVSWSSPNEFSGWFVEVTDKLRTKYDYPIRLGFPGLAPPEPLPPNIIPVVTDEVFLAGSSSGLAAADFLCCHVYWLNQAQMRDYDHALRFMRTYAERVDLPLVISEFANLNPEESSTEKGVQYGEFFFLCSQYSQFGASYGFLLRSSDPEYNHLVWSGTDIPAHVGQRTRMPHPALLRLEWPTIARDYTQLYGKRQQVYRQASQWLHGGHEGIDCKAAFLTPIRACLAGSVTSGVHTAYGNYVKVTSQIPEVGQVSLLYAHLEEVLAEADIGQGDTLGLAGETGNTDGPHLHLGLKITDHKLRSSSDYLNPQPYLDPVRGSPRTGYARTYVLLPPDADSAWAQAVVEASWDESRLTVGGSADDAGIGDLDFRRVMAVNPDVWGNDLEDFFDTNYPGIIYVSVQASSPSALADILETAPPLTSMPSQPAPPRGLPREQYERTYALLPPAADSKWAKAVIQATWNEHRFTVGGSADDAGIGDLDARRVIAINPSEWSDDLETFFSSFYPGVVYAPAEAETPDDLVELLEHLYS
jgi:hypothetical protein